MATKIDDGILEILSKGTINGSVFKLTCGQLDRKTYEAVNKVLDALGGKWNRKVGGHVFGFDNAAEVIDQAILNGEVGAKNPLEFFETPLELARRMVKLAALEPHHRVLEPSAGLGAIIDAMPEPVRGSVDMVELDPVRQMHLAQKYQRGQVWTDFLTFSPDDPYDRILMNPPFSKGRDIAHILHARGLLAPGGRLVAIASFGVTFRQERKFAEFREAVDADGGEIVPNAPDAFKASGTGVNTVTVLWPR